MLFNKEPTASQTPSETPSAQPDMDPKALRRQMLKEKALLVSSKQSKAGGSDTMSQLSDMSYQSDISGLSKAFITSAKLGQKKQKKERPASASREQTAREPPLEPVSEGQCQFRCPSPQYKREDALPEAPEDVNPTDADERLGVYLDEVQQYLDYLTEMEGEIQDQKDLQAIDGMREVCENAVQEHVKMCDTLVVDLVKCSAEAQKSIEESKMLGITYEDTGKEFTYSKEG